MKRKRKLTSIQGSLGVMVTLAAMLGCDGGSTEPDEMTIADLSGSWNVTQFAISAQANPLMVFDLIASGGSVNVSVQNSGVFSGTALIPGALLGHPEAGMQTIPLAGMMSLLGESQIRIDFVPEIPPVFTSMDPAFILSGNTFTISDDDSEFDFDGDLVPEPSTFRGTLVRN